MAFVGKGGVDDMVLLSDLSETALRDNLKRRFGKDVIYTYIGQVLVSVNPYKAIDGLYSERLLKDYRNKSTFEMPPHVYAISDQILRQLLQEGKNQCVIISGESGAGKTEASKKILQYIAAASSNTPDVARVKDVIIESNPLLEAFGNAKTLRNNNSSRFGKYMELQFNLQGDPEGGKITNYLLEKSRVVRQIEGERNFHIFYQLLAGADATIRQEFNLRPPQQYQYLSQSGCFTVDHMNDAAEFKDTMHAMEVMGLTPSQQRSVLKTLACILTLGNLQFSQNAKDEAFVSNKDELEWVAYLLEVDQTEAQNSMVLRTIESGSTRASVYKCPQNVEGALYSRDALAKEMYSRLFDYIVGAVNAAMHKPMGSSVTVGILDIYGFEIFDRNGFEQLVINFVNEKLQQIFIQLTLREEQEEYVREGIQWTPVKFFDNLVVCQLIESKKPMGIFTLLDDICNFPNGSDETFHQKLGQEFTKHEHFEYGSQSMTFTVKHYAGPVEYTTSGMMDRNKDTLYNDLIDICASSQNEVIHRLFPEATSSKNNKKRPATAATKIKQSINELVGNLALCSPHYIRCIKPNDNKRPGDFDDKRTLHQVQYLGLLENVRVRRAGFAYRHPYRLFYFRYRIICDATWPEWRGAEKDACLKICESMFFKQGEEFQMGNSKIFIRKPESLFALEEKREQMVSSYANRIQRFFVKFALQQWYYDLQVNGNRALEGKKDRRRQSVALRKFNSDYINFRENFELKKLVGQREKVHFADVGTKYDRRGKPHRRILLISNTAYYEFSLEPNPDKEQHNKKPFAYVLKRRYEWTQVKGVTLSTMQDGFMCWHLPEYDTVVDCRRKTEMLASCRAFFPGLVINFSDSWSVVIKGNKKAPLVFMSDPSAPPTGMIKGREVRVPPGEAKTSQCKVEAPMEMPKVEAVRRPIQQVARPNPGPKQGAQQSVPRPSYQQEDNGYNNSNNGYDNSNNYAAPKAVSPRPTPAGPNGGPKKNAGVGGPPKTGGPKKGPGPMPGDAGPPPPKNVQKGPGKGPAPGGPGVGAKGPKKGPANNGVAPPPAGGGPGPKKGAKGPQKAGPKTPGGGGGGGGGQKKAKAIWAFEALNPDELPLQAGDVITIIDDRGDDWWRGELRGKVGLFPKTYVTPM